MISHKPNTYTYNAILFCLLAHKVAVHYLCLLCDTLHRLNKADATLPSGILCPGFTELTYAAPCTLLQSKALPLITCSSLCCLSY